jgi:hypothetical protein
MTRTAWLTGAQEVLWPYSTETAINSICVMEQLQDTGAEGPALSATTVFASLAELREAPGTLGSAPVIGAIRDHAQEAFR